MNGFTGAELATPATAGAMRPPTAREQLARTKASLEQQLSDVNAAITALDEHPEIEKVLTLVGRTIRL